MPPGVALQLGSGRNSRGGGPRTWSWCCFNYEALRRTGAVARPGKRKTRACLPTPRYSSDQDETRQARARGLVPDAASGTRRCGAPAPLHAASHRRRCTGRKPVEAPLPPGAALQLGSGRNSRGGGPRTWPWCCFNYEETKIGLAAYRTTIKQYPKPSQIRVLNLFRKVC